MLEISERAAKFGHTWNWQFHNMLTERIDEIKYNYKGYENDIQNLKEVNEAYRILLSKIVNCKSITTVRNTLNQFQLPEHPEKVKKKLRVYLSGTVKETKYRRNVKLAYSDFLDLYDPIESVDISNPDLVNVDKKAIEDSDIIVAYIKKLSFGTIMELQYAYTLEKNIPIYVITSNHFSKDIWLKHHTNRFFPSIKKCFNFICENII